MGDIYDLSRNIENCIEKHSFKRYKINNIYNFKNIIVWRRKTFTNTAILLIDLSDNRLNNIKNLGEFAQKIKFDLGKEIGYIYSIYALYLKIIFYGDNIIELSNNLADYIDKFDNQRVVLQSIYIIDNYNKENKSAKTWTHWLNAGSTDKCQNLIKKTIEDFQT